MMHREHERELKSVAGIAYGLAATAALILGLTIFAPPRTAEALPAYAKQTGRSCGSCHVSAAGGGALTAFGKAFAANGHKLSGGSKTAKAGSGAAAPEPSAVAPAVVLDRAQAQAWSLRRPYYSHFLYNSCDYGC